MAQSTLDGIVASISGGLGNQMFQYAAARALALRNGARLWLDTRAVEADQQRSYAMGGFAVQADIVSPNQRHHLPKRLHPRLRWLARLSPRMPHVVERSFAFDPAVIGLRAPVYLDGHWQSERYFLDHADSIRADYRLRQPLTPNRQALADQIAGTLAVSLHVRRGDYVSNTMANAYHGTCEPGWYRQAMDRIEARSTPVYFVFSDDVNWARVNLDIRRDAVFVSPSIDGRDFEDLHLMALCQHHIIANSSFSWWGAWLNPRRNKQVIAPARWFRRPVVDTSDLLPAGWTQL